MTLVPVLTAESSILEEEPDLMLGVEEQEAWNITVDRKVGYIPSCSGCVSYQHFLNFNVTSTIKGHLKFEKVCLKSCSQKGVHVCVGVLVCVYVCIRVSECERESVRERPCCICVLLTFWMFCKCVCGCVCIVHVLCGWGRGDFVLISK